MLDTLVPTGYERASTPLIERPPTPDHAPPTDRHPEFTSEPGRRSPRVVIAILAVVALLGVLGTIIGFVRADSANDDLATVEQERDVALDRAVVAETEIEQLDGQIADLDAAIETLTTGVRERDATIETLTAEREAALEQVAADETALTWLNARVVRLDTRIETVVAERDAALERIDVVTTERDELAALFPMTFDATLRGADLLGTYRVDLDRVYCEGVADCGSLLNAGRATITATPEGWLRLNVPDAFSTPLYRVDGALHGVVETTTMVPACEGTARRAYVAVTLYPSGMTIADDGARQVTDLGATITIAAPTTGTCPAALAFYGGQLTPTT